MKLATPWDASIVRRALLVAALVGPTLVLVNQGSALLHGLPIDLGKALLTMLVPFFVASMSGAMARSRAAIESANREQRLSGDLQVVSSRVLEILEGTEMVLAVIRSIDSKPVVAGDKQFVASNVCVMKLCTTSREMATIRAEQNIRLARDVLARLGDLVDVHALERLNGSETL